MATNFTPLDPKKMPGKKSGDGVLDKVLIGVAILTAAVLITLIVVLFLRNS